MKVTIITPSFAQGSFIRDCIVSIHNQTYKNIEHIIIDNCSKDNTAAVAADYPDSIFISEKDSGQANAINKGLNRATGDIVCWLNADDYYLNDTVIEKIVSLFDADKTISVISGNGFLVADSKEIIRPVFEKRCSITSNDLKNSDLIFQPATFWRRNDLRLDENLHYAFDWKYFIDFFKQNLKFLFIDDYLVGYRWHDQSKTHLDTAKRRREMFLVQQYAKANILTLIFSWSVYTIYLASEKFNLPFIKDFLQCINNKFKGRS